MNLAMSNCQKRGRVVLTRAYSDSDNLSSKLRRAIASSGMGLVEMPKHVEGTPNTNMQIIVDAMETAISKPLIKHFVFVAGDCTFRPLMLKLRQLGCFTTMMVMSETTGDKLKPCVDEVIMLNTLLQVFGVPMTLLYVLPSSLFATNVLAYTLVCQWLIWPAIISLFAPTISAHTLV